MARLTAPLLSLTASGTIANSLTYATWKGIPYVRTRVIPANPKSAAQQEVRGIFSTLNEMWKRMPLIARQPFIDAANGQPMTSRNKHIQANVKILIDETTLDKLVMSIAGGSAVIPDSVTPDVATPLHLKVTAAEPTAPAGYTWKSLEVAAIADGDPSPVITLTTYADTIVDPITGVDLTVPADDYQYAAWAIWTRDSDSKEFASAAVRGQATVTAA